MGESEYMLGGFRRRPITEVGRVVHNGFIDEKGIEIIKKHAKKGNSLYNGPVENKVFMIFPREICLENMDPTWPKQNDAPYVLSVANGAFRKNQTIAEVTQQLTFRGLAGGQGARYTDGENNENSLALVIGGSSTMKNTGPKRINNGDRVMWQIPDPKDPYERSTPHSERMPWHTVPFDPVFDLLTERSLIRHLKQFPVMTSSERKFKVPLEEGAELFQQSIKQIVLEGLHVFLASGLVVFDEEALRPSAKERRKRNSSQYSDIETRKRILKRLSEHLGLREFSLKDKDKLKLTPTATAKEMSLPEAIMDVITAQTPNSFMMPMQSKNLTDSNQSSLHRNQRGLLGDFFAAINSTNDFSQRRLIGTANTPAEPGEDFEILLGSKM